MKRFVLNVSDNIKFEEVMVYFSKLIDLWALSESFDEFYQAVKRLSRFPTSKKVICFVLSYFAAQAFARAAMEACHAAACQQEEEEGDNIH